MGPALLFLLTALGFSACNNQHQTPKPSGFFRIETGEHQYQQAEQKGYRFSYSRKAEIKQLVADKRNEEWFNIHYPAFGANIHCSYFGITPKEFVGASEDSRNFVYKHSTKADNIDRILFSNEENKVYGTLFEIEGRVASPIQFTVSDSTSFFFRGALYFSESVNRDSIAPVLDYIREDIKMLMDSFRKETN